MHLYVLKVWLIQSYASAKAAWCELTVSGWELGGEHHVAVRVDGANLPQQSRPHRHAVRQFGTVLIERQQAHPVTIRRADEPAIGTEAQLLNVASADISLLDVVRETQRAARRHRRSRRSSLLKLVHTRPLRKTETRLLIHFAGSTLFRFRLHHWPPGRPCCWSSVTTWPSLWDAVARRWCSSHGPSRLGSPGLKPQDCFWGTDLDKDKRWTLEWKLCSKSSIWFKRCTIKN